MPPILLDAHELADKIGSTYEDVLKWHRLGYIPSIKAGRSLYFNLPKVCKAIRHRQAVAEPMEAVA